jgi:hypothetical protein
VRPLGDERRRTFANAATLSFGVLHRVLGALRTLSDLCNASEGPAQLAYGRILCSSVFVILGVRQTRCGSDEVIRGLECTVSYRSGTKRCNTRLESEELRFLPMLST